MDAKELNKLIEALEEKDLPERTTVDGKIPHWHPVEINRDGNGKTGKASDGPIHDHEIKDFEVLPAGETDPGDPSHDHDLLDFPRESLNK